MSVKKIILVLPLFAITVGCVYVDGLDPPKNPIGVFETPSKLDPDKSKINPFIERNYLVLASIRADPQNGRLKCVKYSDTKQNDDKKSKAIQKTYGRDCPSMREYIAAGFALSDIYCEAFFHSTDEAQRRRSFGRGLANDTGTAISTILGLASAGENVVTGVAAGFGLIDGTLRNYDDAFIVGPDLANVRSLVLVSQDNYRQLVLGSNVPYPKNYGSAQSVILRYANICSTLGMKSLLNLSTSEKAESIREKTDKSKKPKGAQNVGSSSTPTDGSLAQNIRAEGLDAPPATNQNTDSSERALGLDAPPVANDGGGET